MARPGCSSSRSPGGKTAMCPQRLEPCRRSQLSPGAWSLLRPLQALPHGPSLAQGWGAGAGGPTAAPTLPYGFHLLQEILHLRQDLQCALQLIYILSALYRQMFISSGQLGRSWKERWLHGEEVGRDVRGRAHAAVIITHHTTRTRRGLNAEGDAPRVLPRPEPASRAAACVC